MVGALYSEATAKRFIEDAIFLYEKAIGAAGELEKKRFSRLAVTVTPYYLECLSCYLYDAIVNVKLDDADNRCDLPKPVRRFRSVYEKITQKELKDKDINGIRDIFTIRNKITAHPKGRSSLEATDKGWERDDLSIVYFKLKDLPQVYSHFYPKHLNIIFTEVHDFLTNYVTSIKHNLTKEQYKYVWPEELISWESSFGIAKNHTL